MAEAQSELVSVQWGLESVAGVPVDADRLFTGFGTVLHPAIDFDEFTPAGFMDPTIVAAIRETSEGDIDGRGDYNGLVYPFAGVFKQATPGTAPGGTTAQLWDFSPNPTGLDTTASYTVERDNGAVAERAAGCRVASLDLDFGSDNLNISGSLMGGPLEPGITMTADPTAIRVVPVMRGHVNVYIDSPPADSEAGGGISIATLVAGTTGVNEVQSITQTGSPTGGTFTLTYSGQTTTGIAYNASAATIQTALEALSNIAPGDVILSGGPINSAVVYVEFAGTLAATNVAQMTASGASLTRGIAGDWDAQFGTTKMTRARVGTLSIGDRFSPWYSHNRSNGLGPAVWLTRRGTKELTVTLMRDATAMAFLANTRAGDVLLLRIECVGPLIESTIHYSLTIDLAVQAVDGFGADDDDGAEVTEVTFRPVYSADWAKAITVKLVNLRSSY